jgi:hypothetical protein
VSLVKDLIFVTGCLLPLIRLCASNVGKLISIDAPYVNITSFCYILFTLLYMHLTRQAVCNLLQLLKFPFDLYAFLDIHLLWKWNKKLEFLVFF